MPFGGRTYGIHSEPVLSIDNIPCLVLGPLCIHSLGHSTNVSPACSHMFNPWVGKIPWRMKWQPTPVFLLGESHGQRSLEGYNPWGHKESGHNWSDLAHNMQVKSHRPCLYTLSYCAYVNNSNWFLWSSFLFYENQMFKKNIKLCINWESTGRDSVHF